MEHPDCLQASMGRLDSAESRETSRRKIEGKNEFSYVRGIVEKGWNDRLSMKGSEGRGRIDLSTRHANT